MTNPKAESTAVATRPSLITPEMRAAIEERKVVNAVAQEVANLTWGKALPLDARRAIAEYCRRYRIDPAGEIEVLGGRIYRTAAYFIRRGVQLRERGLIRNVVVEHINHDPRLDELAKGNDDFATKATAEIQRRKWLRIQHNIPDAARGACVISILPTNGAPVVGANYAGSFGNRKDPVGDESPGKTAETRAYRRAWRHLVDSMPELKAEEGEIEEHGKAVSGVVVDIVTADAARAERARIHEQPIKQLPHGDPYSVDAPTDEVEPASAPADERQPGEEEYQDDRDIAAADARATGELALGDPPRRTRSAQSEGH